MSIDRYEDRIVAYLEGELPELERREVEAHVGECERCSGLVASGRLLSTLTATLEPPALPEGFMVRLGAALDAAEPARVVTLPRRPVRWSRIGLAAAACLLVVLACLWTLLPSEIVPPVAFADPLVRVASGTPLVDSVRVAQVTDVGPGSVVASDGSATTLTVGSGSQIVLAADSELRVLSLRRDLAGHRLVGSLELLRGRVFVTETGASLTMVTAYGRVSPIGTAYEVALVDEQAQVKVFSGSVQVEAPSGAVQRVDSGKVTELSRSGLGSVRPHTEEMEAPVRPAPRPGMSLPVEDYPKARPRATQNGTRPHTRPGNPVREVPTVTRQPRPAPRALPREPQAPSYPQLRRTERPRPQPSRTQAPRPSAPLGYRPEPSYPRYQGPRGPRPAAAQRSQPTPVNARPYPQSYQPAGSAPQRTPVLRPQAQQRAPLGTRPSSGQLPSYQPQRPGSPQRTQWSRPGSSYRQPVQQRAPRSYRRR